ncbi:MAG: sigma factor-like helix-turn-helix DNA-binding protein [Patescibacteria group bacterium]
MFNSVDKTINTALSVLSARQKEVIIGRYGLQSGQPMTLVEIGNKYGVTRERIRQIEAQALNLVYKQFQNGALDDFFKVVVNYLQKFNGVRKHDYLSNEIKNLYDKSLIKNNEQKFRFLLEASKRINFHPENEECHSFWYLSGNDLDKAKSFVTKLISSLNSQRSKLSGNFSSKDSSGVNYVSISKKFSSNVYGDFGLSEWEEINPKVSRDWAFLVLKKENKPIHFTKLANLINKHRKAKQVNPQTIHNELIKDERFILVGRGTYGLKEFNIIPGTAKEVISHFLKKHGPMPAKDLVKLAMNHRTFKEKTLLLSLRNKKYFRVSGEGKYFVKES